MLVPVLLGLILQFCFKALALPRKWDEFWLSTTLYALALLTEAFSALLCGVLQDHADLSAEQVSLVMAGMGAVVLAIWSFYHGMGYGAARKDLDELLRRERTSEENLKPTEDTPLL